MFDQLYEGLDRRDQAILGDIPYRGPDKFIHGEWHQIAILEPVSSDGYRVAIEECRLPARFFRIVALPTPDSMNRARPGFILSTGSGDEMGKWATMTAKHIANGMVSLEAAS